MDKKKKLGYGFSETTFKTPLWFLLCSRRRQLVFGLTMLFACSDFPKFGEKIRDGSSAFLPACTKFMDICPMVRSPGFTVRI
jgi:hypothetical protein